MFRLMLSRSKQNQNPVIKHCSALLVYLQRFTRPLIVYDVMFYLLCQNKDLKSRVTHLEGSQRTNQDSIVSKLNSRIQELEERLQEEER